MQGHKNRGEQNLAWHVRCYESVKKGFLMQSSAKGATP
ncbi:hypothetical protein PAMC26577_37445 [Caballeronia sordidicola]|uniref:Uncharacterized protein n=1 Tax=Caballeronia sordidicola TaxID=196367 RepID=A0A242M5Z3_CABSO|nr:hypothetical protein PAMC26577_37445 [Caballeronia sordidicola]